MAANLPPAQLPSLNEKLSAWLGFKVPTIALPQMAKNLDKAAARLVAAGAGNLASRIERNTLLREAKATAEARVIKAAGAHLVEEIKEGAPLTERALEFSFSESILKQSNREKIVTLAIEDLSAKTAEGSADANSEIEDDWLNLFSEFASHKSNADIQTLWGKILSGKIRNPSSFSLHSLQLLSAIDTVDANRIHRILGYAINNKFILKDKFISDLADILVCEDLGVLSGSSGMLNQSYMLKAPPTGAPGAIFPMSGIVLLARFPAEIQFQIPCFSLTRFGVELYQLSGGFERDEQYEQQFIDFLKAHGATVQRVITNTGQGRQFEDV
jgi:hypothetical protein